YEGDTHNYLTQFTELNTSGQALGFGERNAIRRALLEKVTEMQYKQAGLNYEENEANAAAAQPPRRRLPVKTEKESKESPKSTVGNLWASLKEALAGIVAGVYE
ncbi:hypothetical protein E4U40_005677, partial [Claviceps sp. LM458 group G5]